MPSMQERASVQNPAALLAPTSSDASNTSMQW
jgi:hypothetical protein